MAHVDVLIVTGLDMERDALRDAASALAAAGSGGVNEWQEEDKHNQPEYLRGEYVLSAGGSLTIALTSPIRMGGNFTSDIVAKLMERLKPNCLAMCGVCAGNPADLALGDVVIASTVFQYDHGKRTDKDFQGDLFPVPMDSKWLRLAKSLKPDGLPSHGIASEDDAMLWLLERFRAGANPAKHPAGKRYFPTGSWQTRLEGMEAEGLLRFNGKKFVVGSEGNKFLNRKLALRGDPLTTLPFAILVGPMASGTAVVKDGVTWEMLKHRGQRATLALEMEAASIGTAGYTHGTAKWIVVKSVMDYADPNKDDLYKPFAARASAEVLLRFLEQVADDIRNSAAGAKRRPQPTTAADRAPLSRPLQSTASSAEAEAEQAKLEERWKDERRQNLKNDIVTILRSAEPLLAAFERCAPAAAKSTGQGGTTADAQAQQIFEHLMNIRPFDKALSWMLDVYKLLPEPDAKSKRDLAEISNNLIPWLYIVGHRGQFDKLDAVELGGIVALPLGLDSFAEIVTAGLACLPAGFAGDGPRRTGKRRISEPPPGPLDASIENKLRKELLERLPTPPGSGNASDPVKDEIINNCLNHILEFERVRYYLTFFPSDYDDASVLKGIAERYPALAVIELDRAWEVPHHELWLRISRLLGHLS